MNTASNQKAYFGSTYDSDEYVASKHSMFKTNLEDWISQIIARNGHRSDGGKGTIKFIVESYARGIQANIDFYQEMAKHAEENGERIVTSQHKIMEEVYRSLMPKDGLD